jgi:ribosomal protein S18 acetylase RimI-like enzyme
MPVWTRIPGPSWQSPPGSPRYRAVDVRRRYEASANTDAIDLYRDLGFEEIGRQPEAFHWRRERYIDALLFYRFLDRDEDRRA